MYLKKLSLGTGLIAQLGLPAVFLSHFAAVAERDFPNLVDPALNYQDEGSRDDYFTDLAHAVEQTIEELQWPETDPEDYGELCEMIEIAFESHRRAMDRFSEGGPAIGSAPCESELGAVRAFLEGYASKLNAPEVRKLAEIVLQAERELLTPAELATVRAAIRAYRENDYGDPAWRSPTVHDLACGGRDQPLVSLDDSGCAHLEMKLGQFTYAIKGD